ncbi:MAG: nitrogenase iron-molybdenum cofactor biosynthesis protein NifN [Pseudomonadota bacterium]|uniref:nitrogenase iron-molybdenum cofactor biosynthesis protein NifN n=1 Tax=Novosphingobium sp. MBES04 TaxID=1206458 RepID=UPI00057EB7CC|nr:nitrogenase iron-molybdenum cofactor biosynthesis protein NifN [Novosphingobium sp. MBES04]MED5546837.1 nitrogenase iron-molybdenum cofactor biosynthesis protein NifN [Pseudomonadota bacterium]GAM05310.1 nitrogenase molybdenum-cofactor biosynthesis protein NifN [Novosphingobium sp. MBES04]
MAAIVKSKKACTVNPLKMSQPIGGALAFMGMRGAMPLLHGSQGCTSFGLVLFVRHFREAIPLQTTAMSEVATVLGGFENVEQAVLNIVEKTKPELIGICSTGVTEVKGDDLKGFVQQIRTRHPELGGVEIVQCATPDFAGAFQDGWAKAVTAMIEEMVISPEPAIRDPRRINVLPGCHVTPGDIDELRALFEDFGLVPNFLPDLSGSLDGHIPEDFTPTTLGGTGPEEVRAMAHAGWTLAIGEQMRGAAEALEARAGVPFRLFERLTGLAPCDELMAFLSQISGKPVPVRYRRQRGQLVDAMLDAHFHIGGRKLAIGAEPDLLFALVSALGEVGGEVACAVTTTTSAILAQVPCEEVLLGDLEDLEAGAKDADILITHSHGRQASARLHIPHFRIGIPMFDTLGAAHLVTVGYRGTRDLLFAVGNMLMHHHQSHTPGPEDWRDAWPEPSAISHQTVQELVP